MTIAISTAADRVGKGIFVKDFFRCLSLCLFLLNTGELSRSEVAGQKTITIWLIPSEPSSPDAGMPGMQNCSLPHDMPQALTNNVEREIENFNKRLAAGHITVLNTQEPLKAQLVNWSPEMAVPNWVWVRSQVVTLRTLERFAQQRGVHINVRFITWDRAFQDLRKALESDDDRGAPDGTDPAGGPDQVRLHS